MTGRLRLGLYNCYDPKQWHDIMRITLARAAPVAMAFDCDLVVIGFPFAQARARGAMSTTALSTPKDIAAFVAQSTSIGEGGEYLEALAAEKRLRILDFPKDGLPAELGRPILTTPNPDAAKATTPKEVAKGLAAGQDQLLVFGLGPRGLPPELMARGDTHLELTGRNISMETATALGALPAMVHAHLGHLGRP